VVTICDHLGFFLVGQGKHEIAGEAVPIPPHRLIERLGRHPVQLGEIGIDDDLLSPDHQNPLLDTLDPHERRCVFAGHDPFP
jgi:hypothetical protein